MNATAGRVVWDWRERDPERERARAARRLKREGLTQGLVVIAIGFVVKNVFGHRAFGDLLVILGALQGLIATWRPHWLVPVRRAGVVLGHGAGTLLTWLLLAPFFGVVVVPVALVLRWRGRDPLHRRPLAPGLTAWIPRRHPPAPQHLQRQFLDEDREARALARPEGTLPDDAPPDGREAGS